MEYDTIINYVIACFSCFVTNQMLKEMYGKSKKNMLRKALSLVVYFFFVMDAIVSKYSHWFFPLMVFLGMLVLMVNYEVSFKKGLWRIFKVHIVTVALYVIVLLIISPLDVGNEVFIIFTAMHYITLKAYDRISNSSYKESSMLYLIVPAIFVGLIIYIIYGVELNNYQRMMVLFSIMVVVLLIITFYNDYAKQYEGMSEKRVLEEQNYAYEQQVKLIAENEQAIRQVKHDMKNHVIMIKEMLKRGSYDKLESYIDKMEESSLINEDSQDTGNFEFDAMLASKISRMKSKGICVEKTVMLPARLPVDGYDISVIVGNLLDNAMRAVQDLDAESRWVKFYAAYRKNVFYMVVSNPYEGTIRFNKRHMPETTKANKEMHGIGLKSVKCAVEKYQGMLDITTEDNMFKAEVILYL